MLFVDTFFLVIFLPATLALFYALGSRRHEYAIYLIFIASCLFYANWGTFFFALMMVGTVVNFVIAAALMHPSATGSKYRLTLLTIGQLYNFGTLAYFKYLAAILIFAGVSQDKIASIGAAVIPIGISFYTFQQAVFLADTYRREPIVPAYLGPLVTWRDRFHGFMRYGAFHVFFPQLVIGPIVYMAEFAPQVLRKTFGRFRRVDLEIGLTLFVIGLFKKLVIADNLALIADPVFQSASKGAIVTPAFAWFGALAYYTQLYFDFSGYADMALGLARMFGVRLPMNFDSPLRSTGIVDFYRRWHIALTRVIARFLFTPLSLWGTRKTAGLPMNSRKRQALSIWLPFIVNFEVIALWHGASLTFVVFGLIHGVWYAAETQIRSAKLWRSYKKKTSESFRRAAGQVLTFVPLMLTFALFRSESLSGFGALLRAMFIGGESVPVGLTIEPATVGWLVAAFAIVWLLPNAYEFTRKYRPALFIWKNPSTTPRFLCFAWRPNAAWAMVMVSMAAGSVLYLNRETVFIYMGF